MLARNLGETKGARRFAAGLYGGSHRFSHALRLLRTDEQFGTMYNTLPQSNSVTRWFDALEDSPDQMWTSSLLLN